MATTIIKRGAGDRPAPDITDPKLSSVLARQARGRQVIEEGEPQKPQVLVCRYYNQSTGVIVETQDLLLGGQEFGKVTGIRHSTVETGGVITEFEITVPDS